MKLTLSLMILLGLSTLTASAADKTTTVASKMTVSNPRVRFLPTPTTGAFFEIANSDSQSHFISKAAFSGASKVELHTHVMDHSGGHHGHGQGHGEMMKMVAVDKIEVPANGKQELKPGSYHIMLIDLKKPLKEGETLSLEVFFEDGSSLNIKAPVQKF